MRAFVVRPFGTREGIDFDAVGQRLIEPALLDVEFSGDTTQAITEAGSIHEDMFLELVGAQLVLADISIHNANVFYELGIRHALRPRATILLRAQSVAGDPKIRADVPFDIHGLRYCTYDPEDPAASVEDLKRSIRETAAAYRVDSPVYRLLPDLVVDAAKLRVLPLELVEQIDQARRAKRKADLRLLAEDVQGMRFEEPALRLIAEALSGVGDDAGAVEAWVRLRITRPNDYDANHRLATLYAGQGDLTRSDQTIARAFSNLTLTDSQRSELHALRGSNLKRHWRAAWQDGPSVEERQRRALRSPHLSEAIAQYVRGFDFDLDNYYTGLNALSLAHVQLGVACRQHETWRTNFASESDAAAALRELESHVERLSTLVDAVLRAKADNARRRDDTDPWLLVSLADLRFLQTDDPGRVVGGYERAASALDQAQRQSVTAQLKLFARLGLRQELVATALAAVGGDEPAAQARSDLEALVFIGHGIDSRSGPERFPGRLEGTVAEAIEDRVRAAKEVAGRAGRDLIGLAAASDGGDILFHEACGRVGVGTGVYLPIPDELYRSSEGFSPIWLRRYLDVLASREVHTMNISPLIPSWLDLRPETSSWPRFNRWLLHQGKVRTDRVTVLALWDGQPSRWLGGVANMVDIAPRRGVSVDVIDLAALVSPHRAESKTQQEAADTPVTAA